jgi:molecular chaperone HtpG
LQQHKTLAVIKKKLVRKAISMFQELEEDEEKFLQFMESFGTNIKLGVIEDMNNRARLSKLLRFNTAKNRSKGINLDTYVSNMKEGQDEIYYLGGETKESIANSPFLGKLTKNGYDVLFLSEPIDEYVVQTMGKYDSKYKFVDISKEGLKLDEDESEIKQQTEKFQPLLSFLKDNLSKHVDKVTISSRLSRSPCALISSTHGHSANMERIIKAQALSDKRYKSFAGGKKTLEVNPNHPIITELLEFITSDNKERAGRVGQLLYETAVIELGYSLDEPTKFADHIHHMLADSLGVDTTEWEASHAAEPVHAAAQESKDEL